MDTLDRLIVTARARGGYCTATEAASFGIDPMALARACRAGILVRLRRNAYVLGTVWAQAGPDERDRLRIRAILLGRPTSVASHFSALSLHGLPVWPPRAQVEVVAPVKRMWITKQLRVRPMASSTSVVVDGTPTVTIADALAQVIAENEPWAVVPLDAALNRKLVTRDSLLRSGVDGPLMKRALVGADPACESVGETRTRMLLRDLGFQVQSQVEIRDGDCFVGRVDFLVARRVIVEFDGAKKYAGIDGQAALIAEKNREDALRALGYVVVRLTWSDLDHPERVGQKIRRALALAA